MTLFVSTNSGKAAFDCSIKVSLNVRPADLRRFRFSGAQLGFDDLTRSVLELYQLPTVAPVRFTYVDSDGDVVSVTSTIELEEAVRSVCGGVLRLQAILQPTPLQPAVATAATVAPLPMAELKPATVAPLPMAELKPAMPPLFGRHPARAGMHAAKAQFRAARQEAKQAVLAARAEAKAGKPDTTDTSAGLKGAPAMVRENISMVRFVQHVTVPDEAKLLPGTPFKKVWRVRNDNTTRAWPVGSKLLYVGKETADRMSAAEASPVNVALASGAVAELEVSLIAPAEPGQYTAYFRMIGPMGRRFGQRLWCSITVVPPGSSSEEGEQTPQPTSADPADIAQYKSALDALSEMGFSNQRRNLRLLKRNNGNVQAVIARLCRPVMMA